MIKNTAFHTQGEYGNQNTTETVANITIKMYTTQTKNTNIKSVAWTNYYPLANKVAKGYSNATIRPSVTSLWTL